MPPNTHRQLPPSERAPLVLVYSPDAVGAALLGGLVETLGYGVLFASPPEPPSASLRRLRPRICLVDCSEPESCSEEFLGRAMMRGVSVVIVGTRDVLDRVRALALEHRIETLLVPLQLDELEGVLLRASAI